VYCNVPVEFFIILAIYLTFSTTDQRKRECGNQQLIWLQHFFFNIYIYMANAIHYNLQCKCIDRIRPFVACKITIKLSHVTHTYIPLPFICDQTTARRKVKSCTLSYLMLLVTSFEKPSLKVPSDISHFQPFLSQMSAQLSLCLDIMSDHSKIYSDI